MTYKITKTQGYKPDALDPRDNVFGSGETPAPIILPSGNWNDLFVADEFQIRNFDTFGCVTFSFLNAIEKLARLLFDESWDKSERFTYIASDTTPGVGNSPRAVADSIRHKGILNEPQLPFDSLIDTIEKFNSPKPLTQELLDKAKPFLRDYEFRYDFAQAPITREKLRAMLYRSPVLIAVYAWALKDGKYYRLGDDTHLTLLTNVKDNNELEVFDSYAPSHKTLSADFPIYTAIRVFLRKKTEEEKEAERLAEKKTNFILAAYQWVINALTYLIEYRQKELKTLEEARPQPLPDAPQAPTSDLQPKVEVLPVQSETLKEMAKRVCREEKLSQVFTERLLKTIQCESNFSNEVIHHNKSKKTGKILSTDYYLCQINDYYHIGEGKAFPSAQYVHDNPEEVVRWMARLFKQGKAHLWVCYKKMYG